MIEFFILVLVASAFIMAWMAFTKGSKIRMKEAAINMLLASHDEITTESISVKTALGFMLETYMERHGKNPSQYHDQTLLDLEEFTEQLAIRFDHFTILQIIQVRNRDLEIRVIEFTKENKPMVIAIMVNTAKGIIQETFYFTPLNGLELKKKELQEIIRIAAVPQNRATRGFFTIEGEELIPTTKNWESKWIYTACDVNPIRVAIDGLFQEMKKEELMEKLREGLFLYNHNTFIFGDSGTGKTTLIQAWLHTMTPIIDPDKYKVILFSPQQFRRLLSGGLQWFLEEVREDSAKYVIIADNVIPKLSSMEWETLEDWMEGSGHETYNLTFMIAFKCKDKQELISTVPDVVSKGLTRIGRLKYIVELRNYTGEERRKYIAEIKKTLDLPYWYNDDAVRGLFKANTSLSPAGSVSFAEIMSAITIGGQPISKEEENTKEPQKEEKDSPPPKRIVL